MPAILISTYPDAKNAGGIEYEENSPDLQGYPREESDRNQALYREGELVLGDQYSAPIAEEEESRMTGTQPRGTKRKIEE